MLESIYIYFNLSDEFFKLLKKSLLLALGSFVICM
jgi:hypothetical protein